MASTLDIIIPSATLVPEELRSMGRLPGIIYPINQKIVFDYLYEQFPNAAGFDIICHEAKELVHQRLSAYPDSRIHVRDLDVLGDLGHTIRFALEGKQGPVLINFADTIVLDEIADWQSDTVFYAEDYLSDTWTYFELENGVITSVLDKVKARSEERGKLFVGLFLIQDSALLCQCLEKAFVERNRTMSTFYDALCRYSRRRPMTAAAVYSWFDIGHAENYYSSKLEVKAREFNHITVDKNRGILRKTSEDKEKFIGEILWYLKLPADIEYVRPRIFSYSTAYSAPYISMEYYAYHTIHELFLYGDLNYHQWNDVFRRIQFVCSDFRRYTLRDGGIQAALEEIYLTKTTQRLDRLRKDSRFTSFFARPITVNGVQYRSLDDVQIMLQTLIPSMLYDVEEFSIIHGDLCFANVMIDSNFSFIKVIDPRGKFGSYDIYGDSRYELAKLLHSVDGKYDFIIKDLFRLDFDLDSAVIHYRINDRSRDFDLYKLFCSVFQQSIGADLKKIELIEALLFLSMIPLHGESLRHQLVMLATGLEILNRVTDITI